MKMLPVVVVAAIWIVVLFFGAPVIAQQGAAEPLKVLASYAVGGQTRWDYVTVDADARRVYVANSTRIAVVDADTGKSIGEVADVAGAHGVAVVPELNLGFATGGKDGVVVVFDLKTLKETKRIKAGDKPDAILYDPASKKVFVFNHGSGDVTVIDPAALDAVPTMIPVGGTLEFGATDGAGRVFVNVEDKNEIVAIDSKTLKVLAHWPVGPGESPTGLAIDAARHRLFAGCGNEKMIVVDSESGKVVGAVPVGKGVDGVAYDAKLALAMTSNGKDGTLTASRETAPGTFEVIQTLTTIKGARTLAVDPKTQRVFLPCTVPTANGPAVFGLTVAGPAPAK